jgi:uncharacterized protein (TIGR02246 family)
MERDIVSDVAQVYELWNDYSAACEKGDLDRWMDLWIDDCLRMPPDTPQQVGVDIVREAMQPAFDSFDMSDMIINTETVQIMGERAYSHGTYTFDMTPKGGGETTSISGKFLDILVKGIDGSWKIAIDCHNYNQPLG